MAEGRNDQLRVFVFGQSLLGQDYERPGAVPSSALGGGQLQRQLRLHLAQPEVPQRPQQYARFDQTHRQTRGVEVRQAQVQAITDRPCRQVDPVPIRHNVLEPHRALQLLHPAVALHQSALGAPERQARPRRPPLLRNTLAVHHYHH